MSGPVAKLRVALTAVAGARELSFDDLCATELAEVVKTGQSVVREVQALMLTASAVADRKDVAATQGATSMQDWLAREAGVSRRDAGRDLKLARDLEKRAPLTREAMGQPRMSPKKAEVITGALEKLPPQLGPEERSTVEADLVKKAQRHSLEDLRRAAKRSVEVLDPTWADQREATQLEREERQARAKATFWMNQPNDEGMVEGGFSIDALTADILRSALEAKTAPRNSTSESFEDKVPHPQRLGRAFVDVLRHLPTDGFGNHGGVAATLVVTINEDSLRKRTDVAGTTSHGTRVSPAELRQLACNAGILPAVLNGASQPLDLGRTQRLFTPAQRQALAQRDGGCAFPGCARPPGWTEAHHIRPWSGGGTSSLDNGVLLCAHHHRTIHHADWVVRLTPDGMPEFIPPRHIDPRQRPQTNDRWKPTTRTG